MVDGKNRTRNCRLKIIGKWDARLKIWRICGGRLELLIRSVLKGRGMGLRIRVWIILRCRLILSIRVRIILRCVWRGRVEVIAVRVYGVYGVVVMGTGSASGLIGKRSGGGGVAAGRTAEQVEEATGHDSGNEHQET